MSEENAVFETQSFDEGLLVLSELIVEIILKDIDLGAE